ncbi:MAG: ribonuclease HII [Spirochaetales bacterium]|uniref:Ribonuclease HII n=1 Tax=Candidatus Thalassospirochaeta sargassi TaxID=3119039 RepID=A0AAJ1IEC4_9SPIO|nr:ribonuclease HII [Spirochaetales bacterium]
MDVMHVSYKTIAGIDEAGRGPLAGPVTAAAVILPSDFDTSILNDSKKLSEKRRLAATSVILEKAVSFGVGWVWASEIDEINIHNASLLAMKRAVSELNTRADLYLADGKYPPDIPGKVRTIIKGDAKEYPIMAASILAKTARDLWMIRYSWIEPDWEFDRHKGYPTKKHAELIRQHGWSAIHRRSFNVPYGS